MNLLKCGHRCPPGVALAALRILLPVLAIAPLHARAATQSWNADGAGEGNGTWDTGITADWDSGVTWTDSNDAVFSGTGGTINLVDPIADSLTFSASGPYLLQSGTLTLSGSDITVNSNATISSPIICEAGLYESGTGTLTLTGSTNVGSGNFTIDTGTVDIANGGTVSNFNTATIGNAAGSIGVVTVSGSGSTWTNNESLYIGESGAGAFMVSNGATISTGTYGVYIGDASGSRGTASISGTGSKWSSFVGDIYVGNSGTGSLTISNGGTVTGIASGYIIGTNAGAVGTATVTGVGSAWTDGSMVVGESGFGTLEITAGGAVTGGPGIIGDLSGSEGIATISGGDSSWTVQASGLDVGLYGSGTLQISDGALVSGAGDIGYLAGSNGAVTVSGTGSMWAAGTGLGVGVSGSGTLLVDDGGAVSTLACTIGFQSSGSATISGSGSYLAMTDNLNVGSYGSGAQGTGVLMVNSGAAVSDSNGYIGYTATSTGTVTITGTGSIWANTSNLYVGNSGTGSLQINAGGAVSTGSYAYIGNAAGSNGAATVSGTGSTWTGGLFSSFSVGQSGTGTLDITAGGAVSDFYGLIGANAGSTGGATVSGTQSTWTNSTSLDVGDSGTGTLVISGGGTVSTSNDFDGSTIGANAGSSGTVTVSGNGSAWTNSGFLNVGNYGAGTLLITGGATVSDGFGGASIASNPGSSGAVTVSGTGSTWTNTAALYVGGNASGPGGSGNLFITGGGLVTAPQATVWKTGTLAFGGNSMLNGPLNVNGGTLMGVAGTSGTFSVTGALTLSSSAEFIFDLDSTNGGAGNGSEELLAASVTLDPGSQFEFNDISSDPGSLNDGTEFTVIESTGNLTGTFANLPNGSQFRAGPNDFEATYNSNSLTLTVVVPEPATWAMVLTGLGVLGALKSRRGGRPRS